MDEFRPTYNAPCTQRRSQAVDDDPQGTVKCHLCGHSMGSHWTEPASDPGAGVAGDEGCVATSPPQVDLQQLIVGARSGSLRRTRGPGVALGEGAAGEAGWRVGGTCGCAGWVRGALPRSVTKHLDFLATAGVIDVAEAADLEVWPDGPCGSCQHLLSQHSESEGCSWCPCEVHEHSASPR